MSNHYEKKIKILKRMKEKSKFSFKFSAKKHLNSTLTRKEQNKIQIGQNFPFFLKIYTKINK